jgi:replication factor C subunit 2/4
MWQKLFDDGYSATDIITTLFRIVRNADLQEWVKLEYIKVRPHCPSSVLCTDVCLWLPA